MRANEIEVCGGCYRVVQVKTMADTETGVMVCQSCVELNEREAAVAKEEEEAGRQEECGLNEQRAEEYDAQQAAFEAKMLEVA